MVRYLILVLLLGFLGGWFALRFYSSPVFTEGVVGQPVDLIPGQGPDNLVDETLERLLFRPLFGYNENGEIVPDLADSYQLSADGLVYTVFLKEAAWRDGRVVTAADAAFTFTRDPAFADVTVEQVGDREIRFTLRTPLSSFLDVLTRPVAPAHFRQIKVEELGSGRFFVSEVKQEGETVREMTLGFPDSGRIKNLRVRFFATEADLQQAARVGAVDGLVSANFTDPSFQLYQVPIYSQYFALFFNLESANGLAKDRDFRRAAAQNAPVFPAGAPVLGPFSGTWAQTSFSISSPAKNGFRGSLAITVPAEEELTEIAQTVKTAWESSLGVSISINPVPAAELSQVVASRRFEALILGQEVARDPDRYNLWHSSAKAFPGQNISAYADPRADRALEEARRASSRPDRQTHYSNFQSLFVENNPAVLLFHPQLSYWVNRKFEGIDLGSTFSPAERFWNFEDWGLAFSAKSGSALGGESF